MDEKKVIAGIPVGIPIPVAPKHPLRFAIHGDEEKIPVLKQMLLENKELHPGLKSFLQDKLDELESNAASIDLHEVDIPDGGTLNITWKGRHHGKRSMKQGTAIPSVCKNP